MNHNGKCSRSGFRQHDAAGEGISSCNVVSYGFSNSKEIMMNMSIGLSEQEIKQSVSALSEALASTYALYLKTQNFHWNVVGEEFYMLHIMFEKHYDDLRDAIDVLAERIRALGGRAPGSFSEFQKLSCSEEEGEGAVKTAAQMVASLAKDHACFIQHVRNALNVLKKGSDEGTISLLSERLLIHEKTLWMLESHLKS